jgi:hypothetical protein
MLLKRRIADLERTWPRRRSLSELLRETDSVVRLTGISFYEAFDSLLAGVTGEEVGQMIAEVRAGYFVGVTVEELDRMIADPPVAAGDHQADAR